MLIRKPSTVASDQITGDHRAPIGPRLFHGFETDQANKIRRELIEGLSLRILRWEERRKDAGQHCLLQSADHPFVRELQMFQKKNAVVTKNVFILHFQLSEMRKSFNHNMMVTIHVNSVHREAFVDTTYIRDEIFYHIVVQCLPKSFQLKACKRLRVKNRHSFSRLDTP